MSLACPGTILFDFDSTLIDNESMELILAKTLKGDKEKMAAIASLTEQGMEGEISFATSLTKRLEIATPCQKEVLRFAKSAPNYLSFGMKDLIEKLLEKKVDLWVFSGGLSDAIKPLCIQLGIKAEQVFGVDVIYDEQGQFSQLDPECLFAKNKLRGAKKYHRRWKSPAIMIGDGMSDYEFYQEESVDHFIAYTANIRRTALVETGCRQAESINSLRAQLSQLLNIDLL